MKKIESMKKIGREKNWRNEEFRNTTEIKPSILDIIESGARSRWPILAGSTDGSLTWWRKLQTGSALNATP